MEEEQNDQHSSFHEEGTRTETIFYQILDHITFVDEDGDRIVNEDIVVDWKEIQIILREEAEDGELGVIAKMDNSIELTLLMWFMLAAAPLEVIGVVLDAYPDAVLVKNNYGETPLHFGMKNHASLDFIRLVLDAFPDAAKEKNAWEFL